MLRKRNRLLRTKDLIRRNAADGKSRACPRVLRGYSFLYRVTRCSTTRSSVKKRLTKHVNSLTLVIGRRVLDLSNIDHTPLEHLTYPSHRWLLMAHVST